MPRNQGVFTEPATQEACEVDYEAEMAQRLFGEPLEERVIINAELGIYPMDDDD